MAANALVSQDPHLFEQAQDLVGKIDQEAAATTESVCEESAVLKKVALVDMTTHDPIGNNLSTMRGLLELALRFVI